MSKSNLELPLIVERLLRRRGIPEEQWPAFLRPQFEHDLHNPLLLPGMETAVTRLVAAKERGERVVVFGDYDADGIPATAVLVRAFRRLGIEAIPLIPTRASGYGLTMPVVERIIGLESPLLVTVDNGTVSREEIAALAAASVETIVCDHHQPQEEKVAEPLALINPKLPESRYPFAELCGCALAWKLAWALASRLEGAAEWLKWELDLVALSTVADMVPMLGENRALVQFGLKVLRKSRNPGLLALAAQARVDLAKAATADLGFRIAPRLNAPSRMHDEEMDGENVSLKLLTTENHLEAAALADYLNQRNVDRQALLEGQLLEAQRQAEAQKDALVVVVHSASWSTGVIGLTAGRLMERLHRPAVVLANEGEEIKGSVRSLNSVNAVEMLAGAEDFLLRYGGHAKAGGLTLKPGAEVQEFARRLNAWVAEQGITADDLEGAVELVPDEQIPLADVSLGLAQSIAELAPFGIAFPEPLFESICEITAPRPVGASGQHLSCRLADGETLKKAIAFGAGQQPVASGVPYRVKYQLDVDEWNGQPSVSCVIKDIQEIKEGPAL